MLEAKTPEFMMMSKYEEVMAAGLVEEEGHEGPLEVLAEDLEFLARESLGIEPYIGCKSNDKDARNLPQVLFEMVKSLTKVV
ncbi:hypothetical protein HG530_002458 [Fusarium avenaceum]|nr:hypothetical protein HG530_002458 [Fusarium avenaceum]KIL91958.1 hypothetical protein FAVG1_04362 [Fusarium avenaceum]